MFIDLYDYKGNELHIGDKVLLKLIDVDYSTMIVKEKHEIGTVVIYNGEICVELDNEEKIKIVDFISHNKRTILFKLFKR